VSAATVIRTGHLLDVLAGEWVDDQRIVVDDDGRIESVLGPGSGSVDGPTIDLADHWVVPGLIDAHSHLIGETEWSGIPATQTSAAEEALLGVRNARAVLEAGFTTVRDVGTYRAFVDCALRDAIDAGWTPGPRMQCAGAYITMPGGAGAVTGLARDIALPADLRFGEVRDEDDVRRVVHALLSGGATLIKTLATGAVLTRGTHPGARELTEGQLRTAVEAAGEYGAFVATHAHGAAGIVTAARAGVRSIEHGSLLDEAGIEAMLRHGTYLVADLYDGDWIAEEGRRAGWPAETLRKNAETTDAQRAGFGKAVEAGVRVAYGTDCGVFPHADAARQLAYYVRFGLSALATLRSATIWAAELMGWQDRVGTLSVGRFADLVAVGSDPLSDVTLLEQPAVVVKGGAVVRDHRAT
jgi:imidazolonepropionase-like amidohydrolase